MGDDRVMRKPENLTAHRAGKGIYFVLVPLGLFGGAIILLAHALADASWMASADRGILDGVKLLFPKYEPPEHGLLTDHFFTEIGIAFLVAAILGTTFELFMRAREERTTWKHIREIEEAALKSLLGYFIPPEIESEIREVFYERVMRSNLQVTYTFGTAPENLQHLKHDLLMVTVDVQYDLVNLIRKPTRHTVDHGFEPTFPLGGSHNRFLELQIKRRDRLKPEVGWPDGPHQNKVCFKSGPEPIQVLQVDVDLEAGTDPPKKEKAMQLTVKHQLVRRLCDQDTWTTWLPADSLIVRAKVEPGFPSALDFHLERTHPAKFHYEQANSSDEWTPLDETTNKPRGVLPFQGFTLYWFPRAAAQVC